MQTELEIKYNCNGIENKNVNDIIIVIEVKIQIGMKINVKININKRINI